MHIGFRSALIASLVTFIVGIGTTAWVLMAHVGGAGTTVDASRTAVIKEMRQLGRLETSSFTVEKVIEAGKGGGGPWQDLLFGDKLLLIAHGEVVAGVNLSDITDADVSQSGGRLTLRLPAPQVFSTRLDEDQTRVYDRTQGLLTRTDKNLETEARKAAEQSIHDAACDGGVLDAAAKNAVAQLKALLSAVGFPDADVEVPAGKC